MTQQTDKPPIIITESLWGGNLIIQNMPGFDTVVGYFMTKKDAKRLAKSLKKALEVFK